MGSGWKVPNPTAGISVEVPGIRKAEIGNDFGSSIGPYDDIKPSGIQFLFKSWASDIDSGRRAGILRYKVGTVSVSLQNCDMISSGT